MVESETKQSVQEDLHQEIKTLREKLVEGKRTKEELVGVLEKVVLNSPLSKDQIEGLSDALYPLFKPVELEGKTVVVEIPIDGKIPDDLLQRYCAYIDFLQGMGAKNAVFIQRGAKLESLSDRELERHGLRRI